MEPLKYSEANALRYVDTLIYLEKILGKNASFIPLNPEQLPVTRDYNILAREIADFLGMSNHIFNISRVAKERNIGGTIEQDGSFSFIEINDEEHTEQDIRAILSHEIMHRFLSLKGIRYQDTAENEMLTDIATIYTGLGKLVLNGVYVEIKHTEVRADKTITHTTTRRIGYLDYESFCFVYLLVNQMRGIKDTAMFGNLKPDAVSTIKKLRSDSVCRKLIGSLDEKEMREADRELRVLENEIKSDAEMLGEVKLLLSELSQKMAALNTSASKLRRIARKEDSSIEVNPVLRYLNDMRGGIELTTGLDALGVDHARYRRHVAQLQSVLKPKEEIRNDKKERRIFAFRKRD